MSPGEIIGIVTGPASGIVVLALWLRWALSEIAYWKAAYSAERTRADTAVSALTTTNNVLTALHREVSS